MKIKYGHTNIITKDWKKLADFYQTVFDCVPIPPQRDQKGSWLDKGTGVKNAHIQGMHLLLPGYGENGPTLEIYQYSETLNSEKSIPNKQGFGHIAFQLDDINEVLELALKNGASKIGVLSEHYVENVGLLKFIYIADPDGNIIELQNWS
ncbi:VOC family protein [Pedobacter petrophilus]|uniref:VOC family protein n=1 Tax=Pedobacter petrophilus TaxID=1908241 RepID=A0A7K0G6U5_9SPHI|nr:VOC family protein [Pedobacter petrophilus]MRX78909.1 VOC family protein [Pedobacter petrophilus]